MNEPEPPGAPRSRNLPVLAALVVLAGGGGFLAYRLFNPRPTLHVTPTGQVNAPDPSQPAPGAAGSARAPPPSHVIPESLPDLALPDVGGVSRRLVEWKGHPLVVNFWATWCDPCRREIPLLKSLRRERRPDGVEIVGIAVDFRDSVQKFIEQNHIDYPVLVAEQGGYAAVAAFGMDAVLPFTAFADPDGRIVTLKVGELHRDEADFILDRIRELGEGRIGLTVARERIAAGMQRLGVHRVGADAAAQ